MKNTDPVPGMQQFTLNGTQIISRNNSQCMSAGAQPCGRWANCNKSQAQTRRDGYVINVFMEACDPNNPSQKWSLGDAPNSTILNFTPLNVSAAEYPPPVLGLAAQAQANSKQVMAPHPLAHILLQLLFLPSQNTSKGLGSLRTMHPPIGPASVLHCNEMSSC